MVTKDKDTSTTIRSTVSREISLEKAISKLNSKAIRKAAKAYNAATEGKNINTTLRFRPKVHAYYESLAKTLDISFQAAVIIALTSMIEATIDELQLNDFGIQVE